jgi:ATP-binding cassette ChvD family protein
MADRFIFTMLDLNKYYGQKQVLKNINLCFFPGAKIGIVGENGAGKSTVLRIMAGIDDQFSGKAEITPGYRVGYVPQEPKLDPELTVRQTIEQAFGEITSLLREYDEVSGKLGEPLGDDEMQAAMDRMAELQDKIDACDGWNLDQRLRQASDALMLPDDNAKVGVLSGGEKRRVALCKILLERPDLLLLDEPTNHLDAETVDWLEAQLADYPGTVIVVTHDRYFLDRITKWILELDGGEGIPFEGNYTSWLEQKLQGMLKEEKKDSPRYRLLNRELSWIRAAAKDRHEQSRARVKEYESMVAKEAANSRDDGATIMISPGPHLGDQVVELRGVTKGYGGEPLIKDANIIVPRGAIVGIIGPNGAGKTTLFKMIAGKETPDSGQVVVGSTVKLAYVDQERSTIDPEKPLIEVIADGRTEVPVGKSMVPVRSYAARFGFKGPDQQKLAGQLSGGERNRLNLAKLLNAGANVIMLDEPTNDLDIHTMRMLEEALLNFSGCAMVISHDRFFLNRVCTHLIVFEGKGAIRWWEGNYEEYEAWRLKNLGDATANRRSRYRTLVAP